ncbi:MAG: TlyA family RNA methyltransferase, partial [Proteobacteria bacterium]|nr:TlyA family RNA methyltransferase [Pseudomonadota bacterium]
QHLVAVGLAETRARARDLVLRGEVFIGGRVATKPAAPVSAADDITLAAGASRYVSRGALKLAAALEHFGIDAERRLALDVGASTGGFTEVLLEAGARRVYAVENGRGQLHARLAQDPRVISLEATDARRLDRDVIPDPVEILVADVSFISLEKALPAALSLAAPGCCLVVLVKPQFESTPADIPRDGVIKERALQEAAVARVTRWLEWLGWRILGVLPSPIHGGDGNREFLVGAALDG